MEIKPISFLNLAVYLDFDSDTCGNNLEYFIGDCYAIENCARPSYFSNETFRIPAAPSTFRTWMNKGSYFYFKTTENDFNSSGAIFSLTNSRPITLPSSPYMVLDQISSELNTSHIGDSHYSLSTSSESQFNFKSNATGDPETAFLELVLFKAQYRIGYFLWSAISSNSFSFYGYSTYYVQLFIRTTEDMPPSENGCIIQPVLGKLRNVIIVSIVVSIYLVFFIFGLGILGFTLVQGLKNIVRRKAEKRVGRKKLEETQRQYREQEKTLLLAKGEDTINKMDDAVEASSDSSEISLFGKENPELDGLNDLRKI